MRAKDREWSYRCTGGQTYVGGMENEATTADLVRKFRFRTVWKYVRRAWMVLGLTVFVVFTTWSLVAFRASREGKGEAVSDTAVQVVRANGTITFTPLRANRSSTGLIFVAGSLVSPLAYAPLARAAAEAGFPAWIVELPRRGAFGGATEPVLFDRIQTLLRDSSKARAWVLGGHSRGGVVVSTLMTSPAPTVAGILLVGTSHPRDVDLSALTIPVTKVAGTRDGLASPAEVKANARLLPTATHWVWIEGGNHSQFGWYGFQPGDRRSTIAAATQRSITREAVLASLRAADSIQPAPMKGHP